jgi:hypothetical protein
LTEDSHINVPAHPRRIAELIAIRNYIVHNSRFAKAKHVEKV